MRNIDNQLFKFKLNLEREVKIPSDKLNCVASTLAAEIDDNKDILLRELEIASPIPIITRLEELSCFQTMMETYNTIKPRPEIVRSQIITQNYISFIYLKDTLFEVLRKNSKVGSVTKKCTKFLLSNPVRAFRNSIAHGNWKYKDDFSGIEYWARKDSSSDNSLHKNEVLNSDLGFWQTLARMIAYTTYLKLT